MSIQNQLIETELFDVGLMSEFEFFDMVAANEAWFRFGKTIVNVLQQSYWDTGQQ